MQAARLGDEWRGAAGCDGGEFADFGVGEPGVGKGLPDARCQAGRLGGNVSLPGSCLRHPRRKSRL